MSLPAIVVLQINGLGDQILALPTMRALDHLYPGRVEVAIARGMRFLLYPGVDFSQRHWVDWADYDTKEIEPEPLATALRPCELFLNIAEWTTESVWQLVEGACPSRSVGFTQHYDECVTAGFDVHMADKLFSTVQRLEPSLRIDDFAAPPVFSPASRRAAEALRPRHFGDAPVLFVHPETSEDKMWPADCWHRLIAHFLEAFPNYHVLICTAGPYVLDLGSDSGRVTHLTPHLELAMALLGRASLFCGVDSCFLHAADLYRLPGVALFGPTRAAEWGFRFSEGLEIEGDGSMKGVDSRLVFEALANRAAGAQEGAPQR